jgi:hypothetical protein
MYLVFDNKKHRLPLCNVHAHIIIALKLEGTRGLHGIIQTQN